MLAQTVKTSYHCVMTDQDQFSETRKTVDQLSEEIEELSEMIERRADQGLPTFELSETLDSKRRTLEAIKYVINHNSWNPSPSLG